MYSAELLEVLKEIRDNIERIAKALEKPSRLTPETVEKAFGKGSWEVLNQGLVYLGEMGRLPEYLDTKVKCEKCHWEGTYRQCNFGHDDYYCPYCLVESLVQV